MPYTIELSTIKNKHFTLLFFILFLTCNTVHLFAFQSPPDSLLTKEYDYLRKSVRQNGKNPKKAILYARSYLYKAKKNVDTVKIVNGFYYLSVLVEAPLKREKYTDSMILFSKNLKTKFYPALGYFNKARIEYNKGHYKKAFDLFLKTNEAAKKHENIHLFYSSKQSISILKSRIGEHKTSLHELKECYDYYAKFKDSDPRTYLSTLFALSDVYQLNKKLDSATTLNTLGYQESIRYNLKDFKYYFTLSEGVNLFHKKIYSKALDSLSIAIEKFNTNQDKANLSVAYFYFGKTLSALDRKEEAIEAHIKVDDIFQEISEILPNNRENYEILINHYKKLNDKDNQLKYIEQLISVDSVLHTNYRYLIKNVVQNYDTPRLLSEKQEIINSLETEKDTSYTIILLLVTFSFLLLVLWLINMRKQSLYKQRFEELYHEKTSIKKTPEQSAITKEKSTVAIPEEIIKEVLNKLENFENELGFTEPDLSINILAKRFKTNSKYLSKIINTYKEKSFNYYINDLRVKESITKLKTDSRFRNYTIKAIAQEIGFNTTDAFSKAFYKKNGIHPSYFIKELEKQLKTEQKP
ncbi:helix-turn-helix domain-containing protein [Aquimarina mytili]|uniref:AraC family transcriptional regulator n=1 Tax=Aquimarina mytili TaxID=874423 RepID=A0A936ZXZ4_9FLAO|nr:helix-turn-helix domain-containing protein [Aquimarina mytili]MBL0683955.1 AraC family transcriptional regulator [Aquimarina mytili]